MNFIKFSLTFALAAVLNQAAFASETIVMLRHGEKPSPSVGQIDCQGFNRAIALPAVLLSKFGKPDAIFAPNPAALKNDQGRMYSYIRPLATIEPTAIRLGMPVNTQYGFQDISGLKAALLMPDYKDSTVFVSWEHTLVAEAARQLLQEFGGNPADVPTWDGYDFDSLYIVVIDADAHGTRRATFQVQHEGLDNQSKTCPGA